MQTLENPKPTREPTTSKLPVEMAIIFMNLLLKMSCYVFSSPNSKKGCVNYGHSSPIMALSCIIQKYTIALLVLILTII